MHFSGAPLLNSQRSFRLRGAELNPQVNCYTPFLLSKRTQFSFHPKRGSAITSSMKDTTSDAAAILAAVEPRFATVERARHWYEKDPLPGFSGQTAKQLVEAGRSAEVLEFVAAVDAGIHS